MVCEYREESKLNRLRNYFTPIITYFRLKKEIENPKIDNNKKDELSKIIVKIEKQCQKGIKKVYELLQ